MSVFDVKTNRFYCSKYSVNVRFFHKICDYVLFLKFSFTVPLYVTTSRGYVHSTLIQL
jgi:hypothetical protein